MAKLSESVVEEAALVWFDDLLSTIRATLLPKLLSGEIRLPQMGGMK
jgi:hypothetical protein